MYKLFYYPGNASLLPHILLHEIGAPHELVLIDRTKDAHHDPEYLALNPNGLIPVLVDGKTVLYETAAIALYLIERHPEAAMAPPPGSADRPDFLRWMVHLTNTPQAEFQPWFYPHKFAHSAAAQAEVKQIAQARMEASFARIAKQLGTGPYLLGDRYSAADIFLFMLIRWARLMPNRPGATTAFAEFADRILERPATRRAIEAENLAQPFY